MEKLAIKMIFQLYICTASICTRIKLAQNILYAYSEFYLKYVQ